MTIETVDLNCGSLETGAALAAKSYDSPKEALWNDASF
jgi:hypothetical protein